ncbi:GNAT family N-acetyltransferase [Streptomyces sp. NPDC056501]|uniref:GNAT family N-acetyltransferase n=1 Tax=Streptomyces sp. NPDC056501 TaxID=3345841 RepID=UPI0036B3617D
MGRASRVRAAGRAERTSNGGLLFREPHPADEAALVELLGRVEFIRPETGVELAHAVAYRRRLDPSCGVRAAWVAERRRGEVVGVLAAAPPLGWIGSIKTLSPGHRSYIAQHIVEAEALSVGPEARGRGLGHRMIETAAAHYAGLGYRLMLGTTTTPSLAPYYRRAGFTVLAPGEGIAVADPLGMVLHRPADPHVVQMWKPLHREVAVVDRRTPDGTPLRLLTGVLVPPADAPKVVRQDDGSLTISDGGVRQTIDAQTAALMKRMYLTPVTEEEVRAGAPEALRYGMEPVLAARLRKVSGRSLSDLMGRPRGAGAAAGRS